MGIEESLRMQVESGAFPPHGAIPERHTGEGEDVSPSLSWSGEPDGTRELAVVCHDPDAPMPDGFTHWVLTGIPQGTTEIAEDGGGSYTEGANDFGSEGYNGPMPPPGHGPHHYYFWVYALDTELGAQAGLSRRDLLERMDGHVLAQARVVGTYER